MNLVMFILNESFFFACKRIDNLLLKKERLKINIYIEKIEKLWNN